MASDLSYSDSGVLLKPSGAQRFFARAMYVFFRQPLLFLIPAIAITAFGVYSATSTPDSFRSQGSLSVSSETFLDSLSQTRSNDFSYETPATAASRQFNELMQTDGFVDSVIQNAGLAPVRDAGFLTSLDVRANVYAAATGDSLMQIIAVSESPDRARALADSAIATFKNSVITTEISASDAAESFWNDQLTSYKAEVDGADAALQAYVAEFPAPSDPRVERPYEQQLQLDRLNQALTRAQARYDDAVDKREASRLASSVSSANIDQRLRVADAPGTPSIPQAGLRAMLTTVILYGALGLLVTLGAVALAAVLDRSIHSAGDLEHIGAEVRAVVPRARHMKVEIPRNIVQVTSPRDSHMRTAG